MLFTGLRTLRLWLILNVFMTCTVMPPVPAAVGNEWQKLFGAAYEAPETNPGVVPAEFAHLLLLAEDGYKAPKKEKKDKKKKEKKDTTEDDLLLVEVGEGSGALAVAMLLSTD